MVEYLYTRKLYGLKIVTDVPFLSIVDTIIPMFVLVMGKVVVTLGMIKDWEGINILVVDIGPNDSNVVISFELAKEVMIVLTLKVVFSKEVEGFEVSKEVIFMLSFEVLLGKGEGWVIFLRVVKILELG